MASEEGFDWKGDSGDKFAAMNPSDPAGTDQHYLDYFGVTVTECFEQILETLATKGFDKSVAKVFDVGCSTGGKLSVWEKLGVVDKHLYGVDLSPAAIKVLKENHPNYNANEIKAYEYGECFKEVEAFDLVYHSAVMCQVPLEDYDKFFGGLKNLKPKFYLFMEGINPSGYEKIPNSEIGHHHHGRKGHHHHHHGHDGDGEHHCHEGEETSVSRQDRISEIFDNGYHYTNNIEKVVAEKFPEAKQIFSRKLSFTEEMMPTFKAVHFEYSLISLYQIE